MQAVLDFKKLTVPLTFNSDAAHQVHSISCDSLLVHVLQRSESEGGGERGKTEHVKELQGEKKKKNYVETFFGDLDSAIQFSSTNLNTSELIRVVKTSS